MDDEHVQPLLDDENPSWVSLAAKEGGGATASSSASTGSSPWDQAAARLSASRESNSATSPSGTGGGTQDKDEDLPKLVLMMRIGNMAAAALLIFGSVGSLSNIFSLSKMVLGGYGVCFGTLVCCLEVNLSFFRHPIASNFGFLYNPFLRLMFYVLMGMVAWSFETLLGMIAAIALGVLALVNTYVICRYPGYRKALKEIADEDEKKDLKCDEVTEMLFWSSSTKGYIKALDLRSDEVYTVCEGVTGIQGMAVDANVGLLYFAETGTPAIMSVSYNGGNTSTIHTFDDKVPYGLDVAPEEENVWGTGTIYVTAYDQSMGYILAMSMDGLSSDIIYKTGYNSIYGVLVDDKAKMMYWIENRGIANGIYMMYYVEDMNSIMFLQDQEEAFWLMAIFDIDMMFTADYEQGFVYEFDLAEDGSIGDTTELISVQEPRCIAYFYGLDDSEGKSSGATATKSKKTAPGSTEITTKVGSTSSNDQKMARTASLASKNVLADQQQGAAAQAFPASAAAVVVGMFTAGLVGLAVYLRRGQQKGAAYASIPSGEAL